MGKSVSETVAPDGDQPEKALYIVAIGASAGGLEAQRSLLAKLPKDLPAAYVVVQHLAPDHTSLLSQILSLETDLEVMDARDGSPPLKNTIYVTPPNRDIIFSEGVFRLVAPSLAYATPKPSVDRLLISLAEEHGERSVAIILSGTGSDGAYGVQAIRSAGGITIAQDDKTAKYDGMPMSAVETGCIDLILSPKEIGEQLGQIIKSPEDLLSLKQSLSMESPETELLKMVLVNHNVDFREYKASTIRRRIERRMVASSISDPKAYLDYCQNNPGEVEAFYKDMLISVTSFFRDRQEFEAMKTIVGQIVDSRPGKPIRVWVAGCATGQEAYSIAMLFTQVLGEKGDQRNVNLKVYATDINADALKTARKGIYPISSIAEIPDEFLEKHVEMLKDHIAISRTISDRIIFTEHNIASDVPFSEIDLVCCRNLLIYMNQALQEQVLGRLHYSLTPDGFLFLGTAESVPVSDNLFRKVRGFSHTYRKRLGSIPDVAKLVRKTAKPKRSWIRSQTDAASSHLFQVERALFDKLAVAIGGDAILVDSDMRIDRVYGDISRYVAITSSSKLAFDISMLSPRLEREARTLGTLALRQDREKQGAPIPVAEGKNELVQLKAIPLKSPELDDGFALISFQRVSPKRQLAAVQAETSRSGETLAMEDLQSELNATREELQQTVEELETSTEELQASNEELQATNEELQATNEEYETTNEELQSTNEELITLNEELYVSKAELMQISDEQKAIVDSIDSPVIWVNTVLNVTNFNKSASNFYRFSESMQNPHISKIYFPKEFPNYIDICRDIFINGSPIIKEVEIDEFLYIINFSPFFSDSHELRSISIVITKSKYAVDQVLMLENFLRAASDKLPVYTMHRTRSGQISQITGSRALRRSSGLEEGRKTALLSDIYNEETVRMVSALDAAFLDSGKESDIQTSRLVTKNGVDTLFLEVHRTRVRSHDDSEDAIFAVAIDVTEKARLGDEMNHLLDIIPALIMQRDRRGVISEISAGAAAIAGYSREEAIGRNIVDLVGKEDGERIIREDNELLDSDIGEADYFEKAIRPDGSVVWLRSHRARYTPFGQDEALVFATATDISELREAQTLISRKREVLSLVADMAGLNYWIFDLETDELTWSDGVFEIHDETPDSYRPDLETAIGFYHPDDVAMVQSIVDAARKDGEPYEFEARIVTKAGQEVPVHAVGRVFRQGGENSALIGLINRVDRPKESETRH